MWCGVVVCCRLCCLVSLVVLLCLSQFIFSCLSFPSVLSASVAMSCPAFSSSARARGRPAPSSSSSSSSAPAVRGRVFSSSLFDDSSEDEDEDEDEDEAYAESVSSSSSSGSDSDSGGEEENAEVAKPAPVTVSPRFVCFYCEEHTFFAVTTYGQVVETRPVCTRCHDYSLKYNPATSVSLFWSVRQNKFRGVMKKDLRSLTPEQKYGYKRPSAAIQRKQKREAKKQKALKRKLDVIEAKKQITLKRKLDAIEAKFEDDRRALVVMYGGAGDRPRRA